MESNHNQFHYERNALPIMLQSLPYLYYSLPFRRIAGRGLCIPDASTRAPSPSSHPAGARVRGWGRMVRGLGKVGPQEGLLDPKEDGGSPLRVGGGGTQYHQAIPLFKYLSSKGIEPFAA